MTAVDGGMKVRKEPTTWKLQAQEPAWLEAPLTEETIKGDQKGHAEVI